MNSRPTLSYFFNNDSKTYDIDFSKLEINPSQTELDLSNFSIVDRDIKDLVLWLDSHPEIISLKLDKNCIQDEGALYLSQTQYLTTLALNTNFIGPDGAKYLSENLNFTSLDLGNNYIQDAGAFYFSESKNKKLIRP